MLVSRLLRSLLRFLSPGIVPDGGGAPDPAPEPVAAAPEPAAAPAPAAAPEAAPDPFAGLAKALDAVGTPEAPPTPGQPRDPQGRFAAPSQTAAGVATPPVAAPAATPPAAQTPPAPNAGEVDLTPPEGMTDRAKERWHQLTERAKQVPELERRATEATTQLDAVRRMVAESGLAPHEFQDMLDTGRMLKATSPQEAQKALQRLDAIRTDLAQRFGLEAAGIDPLARHPDLRADVDGMLMTPQRAMEIARQRDQLAHLQGQQQHTQQEQREAAQYQNAVAQGTQQMDAVLKARAGTPGHDAKLQYVRQHFANPENLQRFVRTYQPQQWAGVALAMYDAYQPPPAAPAPPQPLRPGHVASGVPVRTGPVTPESAVMGAFDRLGI